MDSFDKAGATPVIATIALGWCENGKAYHRNNFVVIFPVSHEELFFVDKYGD